MPPEQRQLAFSAALGEKWLNHLKADGEYSRALDRIRKSDEADHEWMIPWIKRNAAKLQAPFYFELSRLLFPTNPKESIAWHYVGMLHGTYDGARCTDTTAAQATIILGRQGKTIISDFETKNPHLARDAAIAAFKWSRRIPSIADPWWICTHGVKVITTARYDQPATWRKPPKEWAAIRKKSRQAYRKAVVEPLHERAKASAPQKANTRAVMSASIDSVFSGMMDWSRSSTDAELKADVEGALTELVSKKAFNALGYFTADPTSEPAILAADWLSRNTEKVPGAALFLVAYVKFMQDREIGLRWFYNAFARASYDAFRCRSPRAGKALARMANENLKAMGMTPDDLQLFRPEVILQGSKEGLDRAGQNNQSIGDCKRYLGNNLAAQDNPRNVLIDPRYWPEVKRHIGLVLSQSPGQLITSQISQIGENVYRIGLNDPTPPRWVK